MPADASDSTIAAVAELVGDKWSMLVVRDVFRGVRRFDDLCEDLGMSRAVLTGRLRTLVEAGVLMKVPYQERPVRHEYRLRNEDAPDVRAREEARARRAAARAPSDDEVEDALLDRARR